MKIPGDPASHNVMVAAVWPCGKVQNVCWMLLQIASEAVMSAYGARVFWCRRLWQSGKHCGALECMRPTKPRRPTFLLYIDIDT